MAVDDIGMKSSSRHIMAQDMTSAARLTIHMATSLCAETTASSNNLINRDNRESGN